ncbi:MAG: transglutaminase domain-containing protein [Verrucomicrobiales bacterium]|nr:transglutaminase domain-containing protein [Verrucomicrobiales bacterium]
MSDTVDSPGLRPPPPLVVSAALLLWGWQAGHPLLGLGAAVVLELPRFLRFRLDPGQDDFNRLWNFTMLLFLGVGLYVFLARDGIGTVNTVVNTDSPGARMQGLRQISYTALMFLRWLPLVLLPFTAAYAWSNTPGLPWTTFSFYLRKKLQSAPRTPSLPPLRVNPLWPYLGLTLFTASGTTDHGAEFLPLMTGILAGSLWPWRNRRFRSLVWVGLVLFLVAGSFAAGPGLALARRLWQDWENRLIQNTGASEFDQLTSYTAIGSVGRLKQSSRIVLRVRTMPHEDPPRLLREAAFNVFQPNFWRASVREYDEVLPSVEDGVWWLSTNRQAETSVVISRYSARGESPLALPAGALALHSLTALRLETNPLGAARVKDASPLLVGTVQYGRSNGFGAPPLKEDLSLDQLPPAEQQVINEVAEELGLPTQSPAEAIRTVQRYFSANFEYSLWQPDPKTSGNSCALEAFLRTWHAGHCEYFATATALLLRQASVPTRYAVGFAVHEPRGDEWIARARDAHAWCLAWTGDHWEQVDTTPGVWYEMEAARTPWWEGIRDRFSDWWYRFARWRQQGGNWQIYVLAASLIILSWLGWRQLRGSRWRQAKRAKARTAGGSPPGHDSEFYAVTRRLETAHGPRPAHETLPAWLRRLHLAGGPGSEGLDEMLRLHTRLRFDPDGLPSDRRAELVRLAREWLARQQ